jgi:anti-sigma-K factor RskA
MSAHQDRDLLAAEFVLGSLEGNDRREAERLLAEDAGFARSVAAWQQRLAPLATLVPAVTPPAGLWGAIEARIDPPAPPSRIVPLRRRVRFWQATTVGALAIAASLALLIATRHPEQRRVAVLMPVSGGLPAMTATVSRGGELVVRPATSITVPGDRDLELWELPQGETKPRPLGLLPPSGIVLATTLAGNTQLLVSLEPKGGSSTGQPTGPVLYGGWLTMVELPRG